MKRVVIESPLSGNFERNCRYAKLAMIDCFRRGEAPFASHLLYPSILNDEVPIDRSLGMTAGFEWGSVAELAAPYIDLGKTPGMDAGIDHHKYQGTALEFRHLPADLMALLDNSKKDAGTVRPTRGFDENKKPALTADEMKELAWLLYRASWNTQDAERVERLHGRLLAITGPVGDLGDQG